MKENFIMFEEFRNFANDSIFFLVTKKYRYPVLDLANSLKYKLVLQDYGAIAWSAVNESLRLDFLSLR
jgi:hypothetical protein